MERIDIPAMRLLKVTANELCEQFDMIDHDGNDIPHYKADARSPTIALFRRRSDHQAFRYANVIPVYSQNPHYSTLYNDVYYLIEV